MTCFYETISFWKWVVVFAACLDKLSLFEFLCRFCNFYGRCILSMVTTHKQTNIAYFVRVDALPVTGQVMTYVAHWKVYLRNDVWNVCENVLMFNIYVAISISSMFWYDMLWYSWCLMQCIKYYCSSLHYCSVLYFCCLTWYNDWEILMSADCNSLNFINCE